MKIKRFTIMKFAAAMLLILIFCSCQGPLVGTLGGWDHIIFKTSEKNLSKAIDIFYKNNPRYCVTPEWKPLADTWTKDYSYLKTVVFYFAAEPKEMYYVTFVEAGYGENQNYSRLAVRGVENGGHSWKQHNEFSASEQSRIQMRFQNEIISALKTITKTDTYVEKAYN